MTTPTSPCSTGAAGEGTLSSTADLHTLAGAGVTRASQFNTEAVVPAPPPADSLPPSVVHIQRHSEHLPWLVVAPGTACPAASSPMASPSRQPRRCRRHQGYRPAEVRRSSRLLLDRDARVVSIDPHCPTSQNRYSAPHCPPSILTTSQRQNRLPAGAQLKNDPGDSICWACWW